MTSNRQAARLTQKQIKEFFLCNARRNDALPREVERIIICDALLEHIAFGRLTEAEEIIAFDPTLLLRQYASNVVTPSGLLLKNVTPYECALSGGDVGMRKMIFNYFAKLPNGAEEEKAQYEKYRLHIENIEKQEPYNLQWLIDILKRSSDEDVQVELNRHKDEERYKDYKSDLREGLEKVRKDFTFGEMTEPGMQFDYASMQHAYDIYDREFWNLVNGDNYDKSRLFWRQVIGFEQKNLSGRDRQIYLGGLYNYAADEEKAPRCDLAEDKDKRFPERWGSNSHSGLGFDYGIDIFGRGDGVAVRRFRLLFVSKLMSSKSNKLAERLCSRSMPKKLGV